MNLDDIPLAKYDIYGAYARSKLAMVVFTQELHKRMASDIVHVYGVHPGMLSLNMFMFCVKQVASYRDVF